MKHLCSASKIRHDRKTERWSLDRLWIAVSRGRTKPTSSTVSLTLVLTVTALVAVAAGHGQHSNGSAVERFPLRSTGIQLNRPTHAGAFFDVIGRRSALFGYENRSLEAWVYQ